jgi:hypothetical protein
LDDKPPGRMLEKDESNEDVISLCGFTTGGGREKAAVWHSRRITVLNCKKKYQLEKI